MTAFDRRKPALVAAVTASLVLTACSGEAGPPTVAEHAEKTHQLTIAVFPDRPGLSQRRSGDAYAGFEIDLATRIAGEFGVPAKGITFLPVSPETRERVLTEGRADLLIASLPMGSGKDLVFAGPYYTDHQDLLVSSKARGLAEPSDLAGKKVCALDLPVAKATVTGVGGIAWVRGESDSDCLVKLLRGGIDAFLGPSSRLAGYSLQNPGKMRLLGARFAPVDYGIGLRRGEEATARRIDRALKGMIASGTWKDVLARNLPLLASTRPPRIG